MKTLTICSSMRFENEMRSIAYDLEAIKGYMFFNVSMRRKESLFPVKC